MIRQKYNEQLWWGKVTTGGEVDGTNGIILTQEMILNVPKVDENREFNWEKMGFEEITY